MSSGQVVVGLGAAALIVANQVRHQPLTLGRVLGNLPGNLKIAESQWSELLFEIVGGVVLVVIAGIGNAGPKVAGAVLVMLWILFLINAAAAPKKKTSVAAASSPSAGVLA